jgi:hypothetical protein
MDKIFTPTPPMRKVLSSVFYDLRYTAWVHPDHDNTASHDMRSVKALLKHGWLVRNGAIYDLSPDALAYCQQEFAQPFRVDTWVRENVAAKQTLQEWVAKNLEHPILIRYLYEGAAKRWRAAAVDYSVCGGEIVNPKLDQKADVACAIVNLIDNLSLN